MTDIEKVVTVRVTGLADLARLAVAPAAHFMVMPVYRFKWRGRVVYMVYLSFKDYYKMYGVPLVYYYTRPVEEDVPDDIAKFLLVKVDEFGERVEISGSSKTGYVSIPIINLAEKPVFIPDDI